MKVTIKAQNETPHPIKVKVCSVSSSLVVLCSNHETTEDTKPPQINHRLLAVLASSPQSGRERLLTYLHLIHLQQDSKICGVVAKTGSGVRERCHHRAASCGPHPTSIWANMQQKNREKYGNYHPLQQKAKVLREFHSPRSSKLKGRRRGYQRRQVFIWTSFWLILCLSRFALSIRHARENTSSIKVCVKKHSSAVTALNRTQ